MKVPEFYNIPTTAKKKPKQAPPIVMFGLQKNGVLYAYELNMN